MPKRRGLALGLIQLAGVEGGGVEVTELRRLPGLTGIWKRLLAKPANTLRRVFSLTR
jgi:hypothetical protein